MKARLKYSLKKQNFKLWFGDKIYVGTCLEDFPLAEIRKEYEFNHETLKKAISKAKGDLRRRHAGIKRGTRGYKKPGYKLEPKSKTKFENKISKDKYEAALNNIKWCQKMKIHGYNSLPYYLEARRVICEYTGTPYEESVEKQNYYSL